MNSEPVRIVMLGANGRMGKTILGLAEHDARFIVVGSSMDAVIPEADVVIDFSHASVTPIAAELCAKLGKGLVIGTTGHSNEERATIAAAAEKTPVVFSANYSVGVNALFWLTKRAAEILGPGFDLEVVEMHHRLKKDAPSGTARHLAEVLCEARGWDYEQDVKHGRHGMVGARTDREIGMHALRGGSVVGDHTVVFSGIGERVELRHIAESRETFAKGALRSAAWVKGRAPGLFDMQDVLGLRA